MSYPKGAVRIDSLKVGRKFAFAHNPKNVGEVVRQGISGTVVDCKLIEKIAEFDESDGKEQFVDKVRYEKNYVVSHSTMVLPKRRRGENPDKY